MSSSIAILDSAPLLSILCILKRHKDLFFHFDGPVILRILSTHLAVNALELVNLPSHDGFSQYPLVDFVLDSVKYVRVYLASYAMQMDGSNDLCHQSAPSEGLDLANLVILLQVLTVKSLSHILEENEMVVGDAALVFERSHSNLDSFLLSMVSMLN